MPTIIILYGLLILVLEFCLLTFSEITYNLSKYRNIKNRDIIVFKINVDLLKLIRLLHLLSCVIANISYPIIILFILNLSIPYNLIFLIPFSFFVIWFYYHRYKMVFDIYSQLR